MGLWIDLHLAFSMLYDEKTLNRKAIRKVYGYARWCFFRSKDQEVVDAVACAFYEHLPLNAAVRRDVPNHLSVPEFEALERVFRYHLDTETEYDRWRDEFRQAKDRLRFPDLS